MNFRDLVDDALKLELRTLPNPDQALPHLADLIQTAYTLADLLQTSANLDNYDLITEACVSIAVQAQLLAYHADLMRTHYGPPSDFSPRRRAR